MAANPFDTIVAETLAAMQDIVGEIGSMAKGVQPYDSVKLSPAEEALVYAHPIAAYPNAVSEQTGQPLTNAEAAQKMLQDMGPAKYVKWVEDNDKRAPAQPQPEQAAPPPVAPSPPPEAPVVPPEVAPPGMPPVGPAPGNYAEPPPGGVPGA